jgi:hypothetical protein
MMLARDNPFRTDRVLTFRYQPQGWTWDELMRRLAAMNYRGAIVGPHGSGKTTLLEDLEARLNVAGQATIHLRLWDQKRALGSKDRAMLANASTIVLVDGAEQLSAFRWLRLQRTTRRCRGLIVTQHREGRLPMIVRTQTSPRLLAEMVRSLDREMPSLECETLFARHRGNLREAVRELYDWGCCS